MVELTIDGRIGRVATKVLGRSRRRVEAWWTLGTAEMGWHTLGLLRLLRRRRKTRTALSSTASHYATEEIAGAVADLGWLRLGRATVLRVLAGTAAGFQVALEMRDPLLVSEAWLAIHRHMGRDSIVNGPTLLSSGCAAVPGCRPCRGSSQSLGYGG